MLCDVATLYPPNFNVEIMSCACWDLSYQSLPPSLPIYIISGQYLQLFLVARLNCQLSIDLLTRSVRSRQSKYKTKVLPKHECWNIRCSELGSSSRDLLLQHIFRIHGKDYKMSIHVNHRKSCELSFTYMYLKSSQIILFNNKSSLINYKRVQLKY